MSYSTFAYVCSIKLLTYLTHQAKHITLLSVTAGNIKTQIVIQMLSLLSHFANAVVSINSSPLTASFSASRSSDDRTLGFRDGDLGDHVELEDAQGRNNG